MLPATIHARVAPETISKVGRLFNGPFDDILTKLLQNSRRVGASRIAITADLTTTSIQSTAPMNYCISHWYIHIGIALKEFLR